MHRRVRWTHYDRHKFCDLVIANLRHVSDGHLSFIVITNSDAALCAEAIGPESLQGWGGAGHAVVGEQEPEAEDWLGKNIENGVANNLSIETNKSATIGNTPNAIYELDCESNEDRRVLTLGRRSRGQR